MSYLGCSSLTNSGPLVTPCLAGPTGALTLRSSDSWHFNCRTSASQMKVNQTTVVRHDQPDIARAARSGQGRECVAPVGFGAELSPEMEICGPVGGQSRPRLSSAPSAPREPSSPGPGLSKQFDEPETTISGTSLAGVSPGVALSARISQTEESERGGRLVCWCHSNRCDLSAQSARRASDCSPVVVVVVDFHPLGSGHDPRPCWASRRARLIMIAD